MKKILFITSRNIVTTCGELRLIKNRAEVLYTQYGYVTDYLALVTKKDKSRCEPMGFDSTLTFFEYSKKNPLTYPSAQKAFLKELETKLTSTAYDIIVISGTLAFKYIKNVRKLAPKTKVFADVHGATPEEFIEFKGKSFLSKLKSICFYKVFKQNEKKYLPLFDDYFVVSNGLKKYLLDEYKIKDNCHIVPCAVNPKMPSKSELIELRSNARKKYGIKDSDILFIYSGGVSPWQCIEQTVEVFKKIKEHDAEDKCKLLILSGNLQYIQKFASKDIITDSLPAESVPATLPCADFAFMLRENFVTNNVAYPNKFLEYVAAGTRIIATPYVYDVADQIRTYNLGFILSDAAFQPEILDYCFGSDLQFANDLNNREELLYEVSFNNRLNFLKN